MDAKGLLIDFVGVFKSVQRIEICSIIRKSLSYVNVIGSKELLPDCADKKASISAFLSLTLDHVHRAEIVVYVGCYQMWLPFKDRIAGVSCQKQNVERRV